MIPFKWIAGLVLGTCAAFAQADTAPRLVTLNFASVDAEGRPVPDLTARELQLTDQGKAVPVVAFRNDALRAPAAAREITNRPAPALSRIQVMGALYSRAKAGAAEEAITSSRPGIDWPTAES